MPHANGLVWSWLTLLTLAAAAAPVPLAWADPPILYSNPAYESPVRGDPDDLLLIAGSGLSAGDTVIYRAVDDTNSLSVRPPIPTDSSWNTGVAPLVSVADAPYSLTVHLPSVMGAGRSYALWVVNAAGEWSAPILINDARPLWITPDSAYQTASLAGLPRVLKVVGRNLQPTDNATTSVRLVGMNTGTTYTLAANNTASDPANTTMALERYVAAVSLPSSMAVDTYTVMLSRDGVSWVPLRGNGNGQSAAQVFTVNADPAPHAEAAVFDVSDPQFADPTTGTPCQPDDGLDDTACILLAIRAAQAVGGGTVVFRSGKWLMNDAGAFTDTFSNRIGLVGHCTAHRDTCGVTWYGVVVPRSVNLQGVGATGPSPSIIDRGTGWPNPMALFALLGNNTVSGIEFTTDNTYTNTYSSATQGGAPLQLGLQWYRARFYDADDPITISNVVITNNVFVRNNYGIRNAGLPIEHLYITNNTFEAWDTGIYLGDADATANLGPTPFFSPYQVFDLADSVISYNTFFPSGYTTATGAGSMASNLAGGLHLDFSNNVADGTVTQHLDGGPSGWRAAFFMYPAMGHDLTLVSNNSASCTGDKQGDGEFIVYDAGDSLGGMPYAEPVVSAAPRIDPQGVAGTVLTVQGPVLTRLPSQTGQTVDISANPTAYYAGYWLHVVQGLGKGQWRKVKTLTVGSTAAGPIATIGVTPAFDVLPDASSKVILGRGYWQNVTVNNSVVQTTPTCTKANPVQTGGVISWYGSTADSVIEGNRQYDTSGILLRQMYQPAPPGSTPQIAGQAFQSSNEVRNNLVNGAYNWLTGLQGGIQVGLGATGWFCADNTCPAPPPPGVGFGISIAGNSLSNASSRDADGSVHPPIGAIGSSPNWETGPTDVLGLDMWQLGDATLVFNNTLQAISNSTPGAAGGLPLVAIGMDVAQGSTLTPAVTWRTTLYNNICPGADRPVRDFGLATVRYCPAGHTSTCECAGIPTVDVGIAATSSGPTASVGGSVSYTITVTNNDAATTATDVTLSLEPSAGVQVVGTSFNPSRGTCDPSVNVCLLGSLAAGQSATVSVTGSLPQSGTWPVTFSVTHQEADSVAANDSVTLLESVQ